MTVLGIMERDGIAVDTDYLDDLQSTFAAEAEIAAKAAYAEIGREVNLGSPKQLQVVLFDELSMPKTKRTKTGYTTDADALVSLHEQTGHPFLTHLLRHRDVTRLKTTVEGLRKAVSDDGRIHTTYQQTVAATGRLSSTEPNLQNIPIRTDEGRLIRRAFIPGPEGRRAADRRLLADRDADHGDLSEDAGPDRGVQLRRGPAHVRRDAGVRAAGRAGHPGAAPADQGDVLRAGLRAVRVRPVRPAEDLRRRGEGADGGVLRPVRRGARLPAAHRRAGPDGRLHRDGLRPPAVRART